MSVMDSCSPRRQVLCWAKLLKLGINLKKWVIFQDLEYRKVFLKRGQKTLLTQSSWSGGTLLYQLKINVKDFSCFTKYWNSIATPNLTSLTASWGKALSSKMIFLCLRYTPQQPYYAIFILIFAFKDVAN